MQRWASIRETNCEPGREAEYLRWYEGSYLPEALQAPGCVRAGLYEAREFRDGRGKYMALCEIETGDIEGAMRGTASARRPNCELPVWRDGLWQQLAKLTGNPTGKGARWLNFVELNCDPAREDEFNAWYDEIHLPDVLDTPGFVSATRYRIKELRDGRGKYLALYGIETHDIEQTMKVRLARRAEAAKLGRSGENRPHLLRPVWRDVLWRQLAG
jgi:hypothetical protein